LDLHEIWHRHGLYKETFSHQNLAGSIDLSLRYDHLKLYLIQKKNSPAVKKCAAPKKAIAKKDVKSKVAAKNGWDGRLIAKILITPIQLNLCCLSTFHYDSAPNSPELLLLKFLLLTYHHSHFLVTTLDFTFFFTIAF